MTVEYEVSVKEEFVTHITSTEKIIKCAQIDDQESDKSYYLKVGYQRKDYKNFLKSIDYECPFDYDYSIITGTIWYTDGTYSLFNYGWKDMTCPEIPEELK